MAGRAVHVVPEVAPRATNEEAYELYLKSTALEWGMEPNQQGIEMLRRAVQLDPNYAPALGMLSLRYYSAAHFGGGGPEMLAFSDAAAERELALDPDSPTPVAELTIHRAERGELVKAHQTALELLRRRPDNPNNHHRSQLRASLWGLARRVGSRVRPDDAAGDTICLGRLLDHLHETPAITSGPEVCFEPT